MYKVLGPKAKHRDLQTFTVKSQVVSILGFNSYIVWVATSHLHHCSAEITKDKR